MFPIKDNIPTSRPAVVTIALIAINVIVYLFFQQKSGIDFSGNGLNDAGTGGLPADRLTMPGRSFSVAARITY